MKICRYRQHVGARLGLVFEDVVVDPNLCFALDYLREGRHNPFERADAVMPSSLFRLLNTVDDPLSRLEEGYSLFLFFQKLGLNHFPDKTPVSFPLGQADLACPLDKIAAYRDFYTHQKHVSRGFEKRGEPVPRAWYEIPAYYKGATRGFIGPGEEIPWPRYTGQLDYELELAAVVGKEGRNIKVEDAGEHIFGYTVLNDVSARDIQKKEMSIRLGPAKGKDFCSVAGPVIVTADEFEAQPNLLMTAKVNGCEWSRGHSGEAHFSFPQMIAHASMEEWLLPSELLGSGTVGSGCGLELDKWIQPGDQIELEIEGIGRLKNTVGQRNHGKLPR